MQLRNLVENFDKAYSIPSSLIVTGEGKPTDIRQTCETVKDFEDFLSQTGMDIRYPGMITYEKSTRLFKGYKELEDGSLGWISLDMPDIEGNESYKDLLGRVNQLESKLDNTDLEWE